jgi:hypothetical protein
MLLATGNCIEGAFTQMRHQSQTDVDHSVGYPVLKEERAGGTGIQLCR